LRRSSDLRSPRRQIPGEVQRRGRAGRRADAGGGARALRGAERLDAPAARRGRGSVGVAFSRARRGLARGAASRPGALPMQFDQADYDIRCEWGENGAEALAPLSDVAIVVDGRSFAHGADTAWHGGEDV